MRVLFVLPSRPVGPGGGSRVVFEYANRLAARLHAVTIVAPRAPLTGREPNVRDWVRQQAGNCARPWFGRIERWQWLDPRICQLQLSALRPQSLPRADATIATAWPTAEVVANCGPGRGRLLYLIQGYETWDGSVERVNATWKLPLIKIVVGRWLQDLGREMGLTDLICLPNAVNFATFRRLRPVETRAPRLAMMVSRLAIKGSADGLEALQRVRQSFPGVQADLFGKMPRFRHPGWMTYHWNPPVKRLVEEIYNAARIFVCPSWSEGFGLPGAEAMACGCALVSTDCGGVREYSEHGVNALLSPPRDPAALASNIVRLFRDDDLRMRLAEAAAVSLRRFSWERNTDILEALCAGQAVADIAAGQEAGTRLPVPSARLQ